MKNLFWLFFLLPAISYGEASLTIGQNHNLMLGSGYSARLDIEQPWIGPLSLHPYGSVDRNEGFHDRLGGMDIDWAATPRLTFSMGTEYEKYELLAANDPTETCDVHTSVRIKLW